MRVAPWMLAALAAASAGLARGEERPTFRAQEIDQKLEIGYAVLLTDINGDGKPDIVVVDTSRVVWYENPTWKRRVIIENQTKRDNVCIDAFDIDGDGQVDLALGADWRPFDSKTGGTLQWLKRGKTLDEKWTVYPIDNEPTLHRIRFADVDGDGRPELVAVPLMGRGSTKENNWIDGSPVRVLAYKIPARPATDRWVPEVLDEGLHVVHNFHPISRLKGPGSDILTASYEGVTLLSRDAGGRWGQRRIGTGNQDHPKSNRGASEIRQGRLKDGRRVIATIEPWHGHQVVVYNEPADPGQSLWDRHVVDDQLRWGHGVHWADLDGDGQPELIVGVRDDLSPNQRRGVRVYKAADGRGTAWTRRDLEPGAVAVEDLAVGDLNGDGRPDLVAVGRQTHNLRVYWNEGAIGPAPGR